MTSQLGDARADALPAEFRLEIDSRRDRQPRAWIARTLELELPQTRRRAELIAFVETRAIEAPTPTHLQRLQALKRAGGGVQEARAGRSEQPFMTIRSVIVRINRINIQRDESGGVRAVHHGKNAAPPCLSAQFSGREHHARRRE